MIRLLKNEFAEALREKKGDEREREVSLATGKLAYPYLKEFAEQIQEKFPKTAIHLYCIRNDFFGEKITVSGLITGQDLKAQLAGQKLGDKLLLPCNMLRSGEEVFLDDMTVTDLKDALQVEIDIVKSSGADLLNAILN